MSVSSIYRISKRNISNRRSQAAFEYLIVLGIVLTLLLPGIYLFYTRSQSTSDQISVQRLAQMGNDIVSGAEYVYPFGAGSKTTLDFNMPVGVTNITVRGNSTPNGAGNEFVITLDVRNSNLSLVYFSKYPLFIGNCSYFGSLPTNFLINPGKKTFQVISCGPNISIYQKQ